MRLNTLSAGLLAAVALYLGASDVASGADEDSGWRDAVSGARSELRDLTVADITQAKVAKRLGISWPLPETSVSRRALEKTIRERVTARLDETHPLPSHEELKAMAEKAVPVWKVGDKVEFTDRRRRQISGWIRAIYPGSIRIGAVNVSLTDLDEKTSAHLSEGAAAKARAKVIVTERGKAVRARRVAKDGLASEVRVAVSKANGYLVLDGKYMSPGEAKKRVAYSWQRQVAFEMRRREGAFMGGKGFVRFDREWVPKTVRDDLLAQIEHARKQEKAVLDTFAAGTESIEDRDTQNDMQNLVLISVKRVDGASSSGSGFVLRSGFRKRVVTNQHIFDAARSFSMRTPSGTVLRPKGISFGRSQDLAEVTFACAAGAEEPPGFELALNVPRIGDPILVLGNSLGADVITKEPGKVAGVGPEQVEVSAKFVAGNSGSPILNAAGRVVGVATFASRDDPDWVTRDSRYSKVRRFGLRLRWDAYPALAFLNWREFVADSYVLNDIDYYLGDLYHMVTGEVDSVRAYRDRGHGDKYHDALWAGRALAVVKEFERLWGILDRGKAAEVIPVLEGANNMFASQVGHVRRLIGSRQWKTQTLKSRAEILDIACRILLDTSKKVSAALRKGKR